MIPTGTLIGPTISLETGSAFDLPIQCYLRPGGNVPAIFKARDTLAAFMYQRGVPAAIFLPAIGWYTAPAFGSGSPTQTGYDQGQVLASGTVAQAALMQPGTTYYLVVKWFPAFDPMQAQEIAVIPLAIGCPY